MEASTSHNLVTTPRKRKVVFSRIKRSLAKKRARLKDTCDAEETPEDMEETEEFLEDSADRNNLTRVNVKTILRSIVTNKDVLAMINRNVNPSDADTPDSETLFEPKLTRSRMRELCGSKSPVGTDTLEGAEDEAVRLLGKELSENESSDDEYVPGDDPEESEEEETSVLASDIGSPTFSTASCATPATVEEEESKDAQGVDEFQDLVIAEEAGDLIAQRTRSRLPLVDTPLESLEFAFIAPDITTDLYDSDCEDEEWKQFLRSFYKTSEEPVAEPEDDNDDPEYNFLEEEDVVDDLELRSDRSVKISKKELNDLVAELMEATEGIRPRVVKENEELDTSLYESSYTAITVPSSDMICQLVQTSSPPLISPESRARLDEHMRMHVQLLTQMFLLSNSDPQLLDFRNNAKSLVCELKCLSRKTFPSGAVSAFQAGNLEEALKIVSSTEFATEPTPSRYSTSSRYKRGTSAKYPRNWVKQIPRSVQQMMAKCNALVYPQLLPTRALFPPSVKLKFCFTTAEDKLIALGLEEFTPLKKEFPLTQLLKTFLLPLKSERQLWVHIKNTKRVKVNEINPIAYFFKHGQAPREPIKILPFDPQHLLPPCKQPSDCIPEWVKPFKKREEKYIPISPAVPRPVTLISSPLYSEEVRGICKPANSVKASTPKRKYNFILPRPSPTKRMSRTPVKHVHVSPMKQISPILKKYGYRRVVVRGPLSFSIPTTKDKKESPRPIAPKVDYNFLKSVTKNLSAALKDATQSPAVSESPSAPEKQIVRKEHATKITLEKTEENVLPEENPEEQILSTTTVQCNPEQISLPDPANDGGSQSELDTCEEEEEVQDNEGDLAALMTASSTICKSSLQIPKRTRQQRELESTLLLLDPDLPKDDLQKEAREITMIHAFMQQMKEVLADDQETLGSFLQLLADYSKKSSGQALQFYRDVSDVLKCYPNLIQAFIPFLLPGQAVECGVFSEYHLQEKALIFWLKLELYFNRQPRQLKKLRQALLNIEKNNNLTSDAIISAIQPFLRNHSHLIEELNNLLPDKKPAEILQSDFEDFSLPDDGDEYELKESNDIFEDFVLPETEDLYGTGQCPCVCHTNSTDLRMKNRTRHCMKCGICFIDGRVFLHVGKVLKPARLIRHHINLAPETPVPVPSVLSPTPTTQNVQSQCSQPVLMPQDPRSPVFIRSTVFDPDTDSQSPSKLPPGKDLKARLESGISDLLTFPSQPVDAQFSKTSEIETFNEPCKDWESVNSSHSGEQWTKDEDKLLLETCQKLGATDEAFSQVHLGLCSRTLESIKNRFWELLQIFSANEKSDDDKYHGDVTEVQKF